MSNIGKCQGIDSNCKRSVVASQSSGEVGKRKGIEGQCKGLGRGTRKLFGMDMVIALILVIVYWCKKL